jgi:hypothetical protein
MGKIRKIDLNIFLILWKVLKIVWEKRKYFDIPLEVYRVLIYLEGKPKF